MHRDDLLSGIRIQARLYGRRESLRVVRAVLEALSGVIPATSFRALVQELPAEITDEPLPTASPAPGGVVRHVGRALRVDDAEAAFLTRQVIAQLNTWCRVAAPATLAAGLPAGLRALLTARPEDPAPRYARHLAILSDGMPLLAAATAVVPPARAEVPAPARRGSQPRSRVARAG